MTKQHDADCWKQADLDPDHWKCVHEKIESMRFAIEIATKTVSNFALDYVAVEQMTRCHHPGIVSSYLFAMCTKCGGRKFGDGPWLLPDHLQDRIDSRKKIEQIRREEEKELQKHE